jgi:hypothetical protein
MVSVQRLGKMDTDYHFGTTDVMHDNKRNTSNMLQGITPYTNTHENASTFHIIANISSKQPQTNHNGKLISLDVIQIINITSWNVTPQNMSDICHCFGGIYCLYPHGGK